MDFKVSVKSNFSPEAIEKNIKFGTAKGLTTTAKQGQTAVMDALRRKFTIRNSWLNQNTPIGIKVTPATPSSLVASVHTAARFLPLQDEGGIKLPYKNFLAMPADSGPLKGKRSIPANLRPNALESTFPGKVFVIVTKSGTRLLCVRGFTSVRQFTDRLVPMYVLIKKANIKPAEVFIPPVIRVCNERLKPNLAAEIQTALDGIRESSQKV